MKTYTLTLLLIAAIGFAGSLSPAEAQGPNIPKTNSRILYHNGPVRTGGQNIYFIFYGNWIGNETAMQLLTEFTSTVGNTPYMRINSTYTDGSGQQASSALVYGGSVIDASYSHGAIELTETDIQDIIEDQILNFSLPHDPQGIYVLVASQDVSSSATGYCVPGAPPFHGHEDSRSRCRPDGTRRRL